MIIYALVKYYLNFNAYLCTRIVKCYQRLLDRLKENLLVKIWFIVVIIK